MEELIRPNPATLASLHIDTMEVFMNDDSRHSTEFREHALVELEQLASDFDYLDHEYLVQARKAFVVTTDPVLSYMKHEEQENVLFRGTLKTYGHLEIGEIMANHAVRALVLAFDRAVTIPEYTPLDERELLLVPARAVSTIYKTV